MIFLLLNLNLMQQAPNVYNSIKLPGIDSNWFDLSHPHYTTIQPGALAPVCVLETFPGDNWNIGVEALVRFGALIAPIMDRADITFDCFYVPNRIMWTQWYDFISGKATYAPPTITDVGEDLAENTPWIFPCSLGDYLGLPPIVDNTAKLNAFPIAGYLMIYDRWYANEYVQSTELFVPLVAGNNAYLKAYLGSADPVGSYPLGRPRFRNWAADRFTRSMPFPQAGNDVLIPMTSAASGEVTVQAANTMSPGLTRDAVTGALSVPGNIATGTSGVYTSNGNSSYYDPNGTLYVDSQAAAASIDTLRQAFALQAFLVRDMHGGRRSIETLYIQFGVKSSDARLSEPEFVGRRSGPISISQVLATAQTFNEDTSTTTAVGDMAGHAIGAHSMSPWRLYCEEHGFVHIICNVQPKPVYAQGIPQHWVRNTRLDYPFPMFGHLGEEAVPVWELYAVEGGFDDLTAPFGYQPRYSRLKTQEGRVSGLMRTDLKYWVWGYREFASEPTLSPGFVSAFPSDRIFAAIGDVAQNVLLSLYFKIGVSRKFPVYGTPKLVG